jgi:hypothetical protein
MRAAIPILAGALILSGCTSESHEDGGPTTSPSPTASATTSPTSSSPERPPVHEARMEGKYAVKYRLLSSNVGGSAEVEQNKWIAESRCRTGGACSVRWESLTNNWKSSSVYRKGDYRWARSLKAAYTCGSGGTVDYNIGATYSYSITPTKEALVREEWTVTRFDGTFSTIGTRGCGLSGAPKERYAISGTLLGRS